MVDSSHPSGHRYTRWKSLGHVLLALMLALAGNAAAFQTLPQPNVISPRQSDIFPYVRNLRVKIEGVVPADLAAEAAATGAQWHIAMSGIGPSGNYYDLNEYDGPITSTHFSKTLDYNWFHAHYGADKYIASVYLTRKLSNGRTLLGMDVNVYFAVVVPHFRTTRPQAMALPQMHVPAPNVRFVRDSYHVDTRCHDMHRLIVFTVTLRNDGGPLPKKRWSVFVMEGGGADLGSGGVWVPPLAPQAQVNVQIPVNALKGYIAKLPGPHRLTLISQDNHTGHKTTTALPPVTLPKGICQPTLRFNRRNLPTTKLNPQPEPPSANHRASLPTVQMHAKRGADRR